MSPLTLCIFITTCEMTHDLRRGHMTGQTKRGVEEKELIQLKNPPWQVRAIQVCQVSWCCETCIDGG